LLLSIAVATQQTDVKLYSIRGVGTMEARGAQAPSTF